MSKQEIKVIEKVCACGSTQATVEEIEIESRFLDGVKTSSLVAEVTFCVKCGIADF